MKSETPRSQIRSSLRRLFLRSRERANTLKRDGYSCQKCGIKASKKKDAVVKVEVHHKKGIGNWDRVIELIREEILCDSDNMQTLCKDCHKKESEAEGQTRY